MLGLIICLVVLSFMYYSCLTHQKPNIWKNLDYGARWLISKTPGAAEWVVDKTPGAANWVADKTKVAANWTADNAPGALNKAKDAAGWVANKIPDAADQVLVAGQWAVNNAPNIKNPLAERSKEVPVNNIVSEPSQTVNGKSQEGMTQDIRDIAAMYHLSKNPTILANTNAHKLSAMNSLGTSIIRPFMN
jgi:hypothetical protein